jgi:hypothetical protein
MTGLGAIGAEGSAMSGRLLLLGAILLAIAGMVTLALLPPAPGVTWANYGRIQEGMSQREVEALLGDRYDRDGCGCLDVGFTGTWYSDGLTIVVFFDGQARVRTKWTEGATSLLDRLRRLLSR